MMVQKALPVSDATLILASKSKARLSMLELAGIQVEALASNVDEDALRDGLRAEGVTARNLADALAEAKAVRMSGRNRTSDGFGG